MIHRRSSDKQQQPLYLAQAIIRKGHNATDNTFACQLFIVKIDSHTTVSSLFMRYSIVSGLSCLIISICCLSTSWASLPIKISLATHNQAPYGSFQVGGHFDGVAYRVVECALDHLGVEMSLHVVPWKRAQRQVLTGVADGFFAASQNTERDKYAIKSKDIFEQQWTWYLLNTAELKPGDLTFKHQAKVSSFLGANMHGYLKQRGYRVLAVPPTSTKQLVQMLMLKRIDAALASSDVMGQVLKDNHWKGSVISQPFKSKPLAVYFGIPFIKRYPAFLAAFNQQVTNCRVAG